MLRRLVILAVAATTLIPLAGRADDGLTIAEIMSKDFVGTAPRAARWSDDGRSVFYERRRPGSEISDLYRVEVATGATVRVADEEAGSVDPARFVESRDRRYKAYARNGDLFVRDRKDDSLHQVTRTSAHESEPQMLTDRRLAWRVGDRFEVYDPVERSTATLADLRFADDPDADKPEDTLTAQQLRLFDVLRERTARRDEAKQTEEARRGADPTRAPEPWYLGKGKSLLAASLAPDGKHLAVVIGPERDASEEQEQGADGGKLDRLADYVTESGYVEMRDVRPKVGTGHPESPQVLLLDLERHERHEVDFSSLPGLDDDPLAELRARAEAAPSQGDAPPAADSKAKASGAAARVVSVEDLQWNESGSHLAVQFFSYDNKDRWIAGVDPASGTLTPLERFSDPAWINWAFNDMGWMRDGSTLWYLSEKSGYSQLYLRPLDGAERALTRGDFEVDTPRLSRDGKSFLVTANREAPGIVEAYRVDAASGAMTRLTDHRGQLSAVPSPDERELLLLASRITEPSELFVQNALPGAAERKLTTTVGPEFARVDWVVPEILTIPSSHGAGEIWTQVFTPPDWREGESYPAVMFVHGAGYLQNVHSGFSGYYREFMFDTLLARRGYVVINMDYRASAGYGRDWRTAIYRQMGWPELEDMRDGVEWLVAHKGVDPTRVGVWGGSYGGFLTFMALFRDPDLFAAGGALRPVADWAQYNHGYTSNILNTPEADPEAYRKSSPIEFADGLRKPLLICHGVVDDNVVFQDTVRLVQRLIELGKTPYFETAIYPVEKHGFVEPSSWTDEYTRIWSLFEDNLWPR